MEDAAVHAVTLRSHQVDVQRMFFFFHLFFGIHNNNGLILTGSYELRGLKY